MFVCTVKASSIKFFAAILVSALLLVGIVSIVPIIDVSGKTAIASFDYKNVSSVEEQIVFLTSLGYKVEPSPVFRDEVVIPEEFDSVYEEYNRIQNSQGFDLDKYKGKTVTRYSWMLVGTDSPTYATMLFYHDKLIGGDLTTMGENGKVTRWEKANP
ncbi:MAG: DUF4830 domain-containing protein [Clostridiales bacterium]|nr:DUF4830 domain-containing protein [Candidatus Coliplasma caballi]